MPFTISYNAEKQCVFCRLTGKLTLSLAKEFMEDLVAALEQHDCRRILNDARGAEMQVGSLDLIKLPGTINSIPVLAESKRALVITPGASGFEIFASTSDIHGQNVRIFTDRDEAQAWLLEDSE